VPALLSLLESFKGWVAGLMGRTPDPEPGLGV